jgi:hypothetical protein
MARLYETIRESETATDVVRACQTIEETVMWLQVDHLDVYVAPAAAPDARSVLRILDSEAEPERHAR